jgi:peptidoglycan/LPS O-acetylase OafA/YrhL
MVGSQIVTGGTGQTRPENRAFYPALDGLRAIAFLMVFGQHYAQLPWGWTGVDLFFVLSGFLITGILWDTRDYQFRVRNFYLRRTLRIFPLYYGVMLAILLFQPMMHWDWNSDFLVWPAYLGNFVRFVHPYADGSAFQRLADFQILPVTPRHHGRLLLGHFWSLCVEEQFYLIWPWVVFRIRNRRVLLWICGSSILVCLAMRLAGAALLPQWMLDNEILYRATPFRLDALLIGGWVALWLRGPHKDALLRCVRWLAPIAFAVVIAWMLYSPYGHVWKTAYKYPPWKFTWGLTIVDLLFAGIVILAIQPGTWVYRGFKASWLRFIGRTTYGAYVLHDIPHMYYGALTLHLPYPTIAAKVLALVCTFVLAALSYRFFETPFLNLKERWTVRSGKNLAA